MSNAKLRWLPDDYRAEFITRYNDGAPIEPDAEFLGVDPVAAGRYARKWRPPGTRRNRGSKKADTLSLVKLARTITIPESLSEMNRIPMLDVRKGGALLSADWEKPCDNPYIVKLLLLLGMALNIRLLIIAGDFLANDQFSKYPKNYISPNAPTPEQIQKNAIDTLIQLAIWFTIWVLPGNHGNMVARETNAKVTEKMLLLKAPVNYTYSPKIFLQTANGLIRVTHPKNYSKNPLTVMRQIYNTNPPHCDLVIGHLHQDAHGWSEDGEHELFSLGCVRDPERTPYLMETTIYPQWQFSALAVLPGTNEYMSYNPATNYRRVLGKFYPQLTKIETKGK